MVWLVISPDHLFLILVLVALISLRRRAYRIAGGVLGFTAVCLTLVALLPVGEWLLYPLEKRFPQNPALPERIDGIILLGGAEDPVRSSVWNQVETLDSAERYLAFLSLAKQYPDAKLVFTGGSGSLLRQEYKGADVARRLFEAQGLDLSRVTFERQSRNTFENVVQSKAAVQPVPGEKWVLITTAWHMPRSVGIFCKARWPVIPYPVDHRSVPGDLLRVGLGLSDHLEELVTGVKEWMGLLAYYVIGKTTALLPARCD